MDIVPEYAAPAVMTIYNIDETYYFLAKSARYGLVLSSPIFFTMTVTCCPNQ